LQESPLRRRLFCGGCSRVEYQRIDGLLAVSMPVRCPFGGAWNVWGLSGGLLFGTLLGPEATGTGRSWAGVCLFLVSCAVRVRATVNTWCGDGCDGVVV
jgi:hypothetical protein